jgi:FKBP-type peptidyl-prolyl cis-trans isomerase FkpA
MRNLVWGFPGFVLLIVCVVYGGSCKKDSGCGYSNQNIVAPLSEQQAVYNYISSYSLSAAKDSSGFYYEVVDGGTGDNPNLCSQVELTYTGKLANGNIFAATSTAFTLGSSIEGLKKGLPFIKKGGHIKLYIPPTLGYGSTDFKDKSGAVVIPANSMLIFDINLTSFY